MAAPTVSVIKKIRVHNPASAKHSHKATRKKVSVKHHIRSAPAGRTNPALLMTITPAGMINPHSKRGGSQMAAHKKHVKKHHHKKRNPHKAHVRHRRHHHNPVVFGRSVSGKEFALMLLGGLGGVWGTKTGVSMVPSTLTGSPYILAAVQLAIAWAEGKLVGMANKDFGDAWFFGGAMQAGGTLLNTLSPSLGSTLGLGDFTPAMFAEPENPIRRAQQAAIASAAAQQAAAAVAAGGGMGSAFGSAF